MAKTSFSKTQWGTLHWKPPGKLPEMIHYIDLHVCLETHQTHFQTRKIASPIPTTVFESNQLLRSQRVWIRVLFVCMFLGKHACGTLLVISITHQHEDAQVFEDSSVVPHDQLTDQWKQQDWGRKMIGISLHDPIFRLSNWKPSTAKKYFPPSMYQNSSTLSTLTRWSP